MGSEEIRKQLSVLKQAFLDASKAKPDEDPVKSMYDFKTRKSTYVIGTIESRIVDLKKSLWTLTTQYTGNENAIIELLILYRELEKNKRDYRKAVDVVERMINVSYNLRFGSPRTDNQTLRLNIPQLPLEIRDDLTLDIKELEKCFNAGCYRSAIIICGRILETTLHRKYFDVTQRDILETNPGIGLGTLIAKLNDKDIKFEPGLTQQIHLINQVRVFSVHKKQDAFNPSAAQAQAIILYTMDVLSKVFGN